MHKSITSTLSLLLLVAACSASAQVVAVPAVATAAADAAVPAADVGNNPADPMLGGKDLGPSIACISTTQIRKTRIIDDRTIMFQVGNRWYRNDIGASCMGLGPRMAIIDRPHGGQLCQGNIIDVVQPGAGQGIGMHKGSCSYGRFTPYMPPPPAK